MNFRIITELFSGNNDKDTEDLAKVMREWKLARQVDNSLRTSEKLKDYIYSYKFRINSRFRTCAGLVRYSEKIIELHPELMKPKRIKERNETLLHEIAHAIAYKRFRHRGHGEPWRKIFMDIGGSKANRCHHYPFLKGMASRYVYTCKDCGYEIERTRLIHKKGRLNLLYHPPCLKKKNKGRFSVRDKKEH